MRNRATANHWPAEAAPPSLEKDRSALPSQVHDRSANRFAPSDWRDDAVGRPIHSVLVPTDFSPGSLRAVERALELVQPSGATLTILHVIDINPASASNHCGSADALMRQLWSTGIAGLARLKKSLEESKVKIETLLVEGLPHEAIVENSCHYDLLVINEPCSKSAWNFFSKHTARRVIKQAKCPVRVVRQQTGLASLDLRSQSQVVA